MRLTHEAYAEHVRADAALLAEAAGSAGLDTPVPSCPGWSVRDLVEHVAETYFHKVACMRDKAFPDPWPPPRDDTPALTHLADAAAALLAELTSRDPGEFAATWWWDEQTVGFWGRRMAHESAIHRIDAQLAAGAVSAVDDALAVDGVDEILRLHLAGDWSDDPVEGLPGATLRVVSGEHAWRVVMEPAAVVANVDKWPDEPVRAVVRGEPGALYLGLWGRGDDALPVVEGEQAVADHFRERLRLATQ